MSTAIHRQVEQLRRGEFPRAIGRVASGWVIMGQSQHLPGYCLLLPDPVVGSLNDLGPGERAQYLADMARIGDAVSAVCSPRRINYEMLGNLEPALHAHVVPRYEHEPDELRTKAIWLYPPELWEAPEHQFQPSNPEHRRLAAAIGAELARTEQDRSAVECAFTGAAPCDMFQRACAFAARAHDGQYRKDGRTPYVSHPFRVAMIVRDVFGCDDEEALAAAVLHDTIEDTRTDYDDLLAAFGRTVADLVVPLTKDMRLEDAARELEYDRALAASDWRARLIKLADVYDNLCDLSHNPSGDPVEHRKKCERASAIASPLAAVHGPLARAIALVQKASATCGNR